jgi:hypothetical protein
MMYISREKRSKQAVSVIDNEKMEEIFGGVIYLAGAAVIRSWLGWIDVDINHCRRPSAISQKEHSWVCNGIQSERHIL